MLAKFQNTIDNTHSKRLEHKSNLFIKITFCLATLLFNKSYDTTFEKIF